MSDHVRLSLSAIRKLLLALICALLPAWGAADGASFLNGAGVREVRENFSDIMEQVATVFETNVEVSSDPRQRAILMAQAGSSMANVLAAWEPHIKGDEVGDAFLAEGMSLVTCLGLASFADVEAQVALLQVAAGYLRMALPEPLPDDLCTHE